MQIGKIQQVRPKYLGKLKKNFFGPLIKKKFFWDTSKIGTPTLQKSRNSSLENGSIYLKISMNDPWDITQKMLETDF